MKLQNLINILIGIVCIGLLPGAQAVVPPPDGDYPGGNTAEGQNRVPSASPFTMGAATHEVWADSQAALQFQMQAKLPQKSKLCRRRGRRAASLWRVGTM